MLKQLTSRVFGSESSEYPTDQLLTGWGRTAPSRATIYRPESDAEIAQIVAQRSPRGLIARGLGRSYGDPAQNAGGTVLDMTHHVGIHAFDVDRGVITVDAGVSLERLITLVLPFGFFLPVTPGTRFVTVGGAIASDIHGKNHHVDGSLAAHVTEFVLLSPSGEVRTITPESAPDLFWATAGGMGLTGIILRATIQLPRVETSRLIVDTDRTRDLDETMHLQSTGDDQYQYSVAWVDCISRGKALGRSILMRGNHATLADTGDTDSLQALHDPSPPSVTAPPWMPSGLLRGSSVRLLNEGWYRKAPVREHGALQSIKKFFYPLDWIGEWNRFYGSSGFLQYQFVVPLDRHDVVRKVIETLADGGWPTALAVLKRMGPSRGPLSFAIEGWTLAIDVPAGLTGLQPLLDGFDRMVADAGGRIYLAKDSRMRPELVPVMYPEIDAWRQVVDSVDSERRMRSDLERRLSLRTEI